MLTHASRQFPSWLIFDVRQRRAVVPQYREIFPQGSVVRVKERAALDSFRTEWRYHNPLTHTQLAFAGREATVVSVGFYHGGDVLYSLDGIPGVWHEVCLEPWRPDDPKA